MHVAIADKAADDDLPYAFDFTDWELLTPSEKIVSAVVSATPSGLTISSPTVNSDGDVVTARISGGTASTRYRVTCVATTTSGYDLTGFADITVRVP